jgi:NAD(P)-dependent dehydrogenase (short-subunit alcohol dehydrogenase family)
MILDKFSLDGKVGIVTGGGAGLGKAYCQACAQAGAVIVVAEIEADSGTAMEDELQHEGQDAMFVQTDLRDLGSIQAMVDQTIGKYGQIDFVINNAGMWSMGRIEETTEESWNYVMDLNVNGMFFCCQAVGKEMIARGGGSIINVSSVSGVIINRATPDWLEASYFASKAAVIHLTKSLAAQWAEYNIRANVIAPGYMAKVPFDPEAPKPAWLDGIPLGRPGRPEELGTVAVFLASEASSYITGDTILVDGGYTIY